MGVVVGINHFNQIKPFQNTQEALHEVLVTLADYVPFKLWMVARLDDDDWTVVQALDQAYGVTRGLTFDWSTTYCSHMVRGEAPMFAENSSLVEVYRRAPINQALPVPIGAYIGFPLFHEHGGVAATLCALDPEPQPVLGDVQQRLVRTMARSLSTLINIHSQAEAAEREAQRLRFVSETDALTGLCNRRGWESALQEQEATGLRYVRNALVVIIDLDDLKLVNDSQGHDAGDRLIQRAAQTIRHQFRDQDVTARIGGDEFAVLVDGATSRQGQVLVDRLRLAFHQAGISASIGHAVRLYHDSMAGTVRAADAAMYEDKRRRKQV